MSFNTALTGLSAASADLGVISNNIANNNTMGFKESRAEFGDIYSVSVLGTATHRTIGSGVKLNSINQQFKQGSLDPTGNPLDLAVDGEGFFILRNSDGGITYTRAGIFGVDKDGYLVNSLGERLQGYQADSTSGKITSTRGDLQLPKADLAPNTTTTAEIGVNLAASAPGLNPAEFDYENASTYSYSTEMTVFDSLGNSHTLTVYFIKDGGDGADPASAPKNTWQVKFSVDGNEPEDSGGEGTLTFDENGKLESGSPIDLSIDLTIVDPGNGATSPLEIEVNFDNATQFGGAFSTNTLTQDGYASGQLVSVDVGDDGVLFGRYSNGQSKALGQVTLANFRNPQGLGAVGDASWVETSTSGQPIIGPPGTSGLGLVRAGMLELSNVELTEQLVNMINAQRNFQANAQVISTNDQMTQTLLNLR